MATTRSGRPAATVLWDVGGTLVDYALASSEVLARAFNQARIDRRVLNSENIAAAQEFFERTNLRWRTLTEEREGFVAASEMMLQESGYGVSAVSRLADALADYYDRYQPVPAIPDLLAELVSYGVQNGVVSNWPPTLPAFLEHHGLGTYFDQVIASGPEGFVKPDPALFQVALTRFGIQAADAVHVGDNPAFDIMSARELGMHAIHFNPRGEHSRADARDVATLRRLLVEWLAIVT